ncbi:MAG: response regulator [Phaeodactylibacter sp.]|nr:response regulator [Phaeodactylibacter sp.]
MAARILVVDDEPQFERLILQRFRKQVRAGLFDFVFASNGEEALRIIEQEESLAMVLTDINMPIMDGLTLISKVRELEQALKMVVVSAYGDMKNIRAAMNLGAFDFLTKPIDFSDLEATIQKTLEEVQLLRQAELANRLSDENEKLEELDQLKSQFFTNISHEFRTPLTVITGMAKQIETNPDQLLTKGLAMIRRNAYNLLDLVNQILDLHKVEAGAMPVHLMQADLIAYLQQIAESYEALAETKEIKLHFSTSEETLVMDYDAEKMLRIFSNLLGNGIKFTEQGGEVFFDIAKVDGEVQLKVRDTGIGISQEQLPKVFDRFYQIERLIVPGKTGTGVGLSLVKEFVDLLGGRIEVESQAGEGTTFTLYFQIHREAPEAQDYDTSGLMLEQLLLSRQPAISEAGKQMDNEDLDVPKVLVMEDHPDVAQYLISCLEGRYRVEWAADGEKGIERALEQIPDLIISDVMMPRKDGLQVCETLKTDTRTSHIPIVLLTAKADIESRIAGLKRGADDYLAKPFEKEELLIRLSNLLEQREKLRKHFQALAAEEGEGMADANEPEDQFILQIRELIETNIEDENFGIHEVCRAIGMSRTQLHRKIKALTDRSTSSFLRSIRLNRARKILKTTDLNVSQVAYEVGFRDPKYFSRTFAEEFGFPPAEMRK